MASLDSVSIAILLGAVLVMAGILSSLLALRFGAPLLLVFLFIGMLAGDAGPGQLKFNDVGTTYLVGSVALALILFDGGLRDIDAGDLPALAGEIDGVAAIAHSDIESDAGLEVGSRFEDQCAGIDGHLAVGAEIDLIPARAGVFGCLRRQRKREE